MNVSRIHNIVPFLLFTKRFALRFRKSYLFMSSFMSGQGASRLPDGKYYRRQKYFIFETEIFWREYSLKCVC